MPTRPVKDLLCCLDAMKIVSRGRRDAQNLEDARTLLKTIHRLRGGPLIPRGVYRFATFEEADVWMRRAMAATHVRHNSKTS
jgi:hypothetical protein